uniref:Uncharacterized protein n=1 Tax=Romanomermis culicivorax TaxID=13658 RepID=A0A915K049_ROMCU
MFQENPRPFVCFGFPNIPKSIHFCMCIVKPTSLMKSDKSKQRQKTEKDSIEMGRYDANFEGQLEV